MLKKGLVGVVLVGFLALLLSRPTTGIHSAVPSGGDAFEPLAYSMVGHLGDAHGVEIGSSTQDDIVIRPVEAYVEVEFTPEFVKRLRDDAFVTLELDGPRTVMSESRYNTFLFMLHAYLTMAPAAPKEGRTYRPHE